MSAPVVATIGLTLEQVKALQFVSVEVPTADLLPWVHEAINRLSIDSADAVLDRPAPDEETTLWKMGEVAGLVEAFKPDATIIGRLDGLRADMARFLPTEAEGEAA
jgi:hypothetical protein